jgi:hypothetical protein
LIRYLAKSPEVHLENGNPALVQAMHELALKDNEENRRRLYELLLGSMLLIPVTEIPPGLSSGTQTVKTNVPIQFTGTVDRNQLRVTPAFTDVEALRNWDPNTPPMGIKTQEFFRLLMGTDIQEIVMNPFDPIRKMIRPGGRISRAEFELLSNGLAPTRVGPKGVQFQLKPNEEVFIGIPAESLSSEVEELLRNKAVGLPEINELYLFQMATQAGSSHTVIGLQLGKLISKEQEEKLARSLGDSIQSKLAGGRSLDFVILRGTIGDQVRSCGALIFRRL